jgi:hypothetical protein
VVLAYLLGTHVRGRLLHKWTARGQIDRQIRGKKEGRKEGREGGREDENSTGITVLPHFFH